MSERPPIEQPSAELMRKIDAACDRFERTWGTPEARRIEDMIRDFDGSQSTLLKHLIRVEMELLAENAPSDPGRFYVERFPNHQQWIRKIYAWQCDDGPLGTISETEDGLTGGESSRRHAGRVYRGAGDFKVGNGDRQRGGRGNAANGSSGRRRRPPEDNATAVNELLDRAANQDKEAIGLLLDMYQDRLTRLVEFQLDPRLRSRFCPDDVVQDILSLAYPRLASYLDTRPISFYGWLRQIAVNQMIDLYRRHVSAEMRTVKREEAHQPQSPDDAANAADATSPSEHLARKERIEFVRATLETIDADHRDLIVMRHFEQLSTAEVAEILGINEGAARTRLVRALKKFQAAVVENDGSQHL